MRTILVLLLLCLFACQAASTVEETTTPNPFTPEKAQLFSIKPDSAILIKGKLGSMLEIPAGAFVLENGQEPKGMIQLELKEVFTKGSMLANKLSTTSEGRLIESTGMVYVAANSEGRTLKLKPEKEIRLSIPNKEGFSQADFFEGSFNEKGIMNWALAENTIDTIIVIKEFISEGFIGTGPMDIISTKKYKQIGDTLILLNEDTTIPGSDIDYLDDDEATPPYFQFAVKNLGWINCDRFLEIENPTSLTISLKDKPQALAYLVFHDLNSVMELFFDQGAAVASRLPRDEQVSLLVIDKKDDRYYLYKQLLRLGEQETTKVDLKEVPLSTIQDEVQKFDQVESL